MWFFGLLGGMSLVVLGLFAAGIGPSIRRTLGALIVSAVVWLLASYGLVFIWINTYGT